MFGFNFNNLISSNVTSVTPVNDKNDVAGSAAVQPGYIPAEILSNVVEPAVDIDGVTVSTSVSNMQTISSGAGVQQQESSNYIQSDAPAQDPVTVVLDQYDMNSIQEVDGALNYIEPNSASIQGLLNMLYEQGILVEGMTNDQMALAIHNYVSQNYAYTSDASDEWNTVAQTIANGGGDCEDLANLEASLLTAALVKGGMSLSDATSRVTCIVLYDDINAMGHVMVQYTRDNGSNIYLNPTTGAYSATISTNYEQIFTYNSQSVSVQSSGFDWALLRTATEIAFDDDASLDTCISLIQEGEAQIDDINDEIFKASLAAQLANAYASVEYWSGQANNATQLAKANEALSSALLMYQQYYPGMATDLNSVLINPDAQGLLYKNSDGYYEMDWDNPFFTTLKDKITGLKGALMVITMVYEGIRDMRSAAVQELSDGEMEGVKGMNITKIMQKKVSSVDKDFKAVIANALQAMSSLNKAKSDDEIADINSRHDTENNNIQNDSPVLCEPDDREQRKAENERARLQEINAVKNKLSAINSRNAAAASQLLSSISVDVAAGSDLEQIWGQLNSSITQATNSLGSLERQTTSTSDDSQYHELDRGLATTIRGNLTAAIGIRRIALMIKQGIGEMRNVVHQEMTGIGGRTQKTEIASEINESKGKDITAWFDSYVSFTEEKISLNNQIRYNKLEIEKLDKLIAKLEANKTWSWISAVFKVVASVFSVIGVISALFPVLGWISAGVCALVAAGCAYVSGLIDSHVASDNANYRAQLQNDYAHQVIQLTPQAPSLPSQTSSTTGDTIYDMAVNAENNATNIINNMTGSNYLNTMDDGWASGITGSSYFDAALFGQATQKIAAQQTLLLAIDSIRRAKNEMRNAAHMEMTQIDGRHASSSLSYAFDAAREQMGFVTNNQYMQLVNQNYANNVRYQFQQQAYMYTQYANAASNAAGWSWVPFAGSPIGQNNATNANLNTQLNANDQTAHDSNGNINSATTSATFDDAAFNNLIANGLLNTGNGNVGANYSMVADVRDAFTQAYVAASVQGSLNKALRDIRKIVHMEMTDIGGAEDISLSDQANYVMFQAKLKTLSQITNYLSQKAQIQNRVEDAQDNIVKIENQLNSNETAFTIGAIAAVVVAAILMYLGDYTDAMTALGTIGGAMEAGSALLSAVTAWGTEQMKNFELIFARSQAVDDTGALASYVRAKESMNNNVNSIDNRLENLEQQCLNEINENLFQDMGNGQIGVNSGLASQYQTFMEGQYRAEQTKSKLQSAMQELRNIVNEAMTGKSGAQPSSATQMALEMKMQNMKAKINDMFSMLDLAVNRWNEISEAKMAAARAEAEHLKALVSAIISTVTEAVSLYMTFCPEALQLNEANIKYNAEKELLKDPKGIGLQAGVEEAGKELEIKKAAMEKVSSSMEGIMLALDVAPLVNELAFAFITQNMMTDAREARKSQTSNQGFNKGISSDAKTSQVAGVVAGDYEAMAANAEAASGQTVMDAEKAAIATDTTISSEFNDSMSSLYNQLPDAAVKQLKKLAKFQQKAIAEKKTDIKNALRSVPGFNELNPVSQKTVVNALFNAGITPEMLSGPNAQANMVKMVQKVMATMKEFETQLEAKDVRTSAMPVMAQAAAMVNDFKALQRANNTGLLAQIDQTLQTVNGEISSLQTKEAELQKQVQKDPSLRDQLSNLQRLLDMKKKELEVLKSMKTTLENKDLKQAQQVAAEYAKAFDEKFRKALEEGLKLEAQIKEYEEMLAKGDESLKGVIQVKLNELKAKLAELKANLELARAEKEISEGSIKRVESDIKSVEDQMGPLQKEIDSIKGDIQAVIKGISAESKAQERAGKPGEQPADQGGGKGGGQNNDSGQSGQNNGQGQQGGSVDTKDKGQQEMDQARGKK